MTDKSIKIIVIGGSWGGIQASLSILKDLPSDYEIPIILILHRQKDFKSDLASVLKSKISLNVVEVEEKEKIQHGHVYLAPPDYHVLIEKDGIFSLDVSEPEHYSRPSIDVTFTSASEVFRSGTVGILLTGANKDGSIGLKNIADNGGIVIAQDPDEAEINTMPSAAIKMIPDCKIYTLDLIKKFLLSLI
jgi:two-component system, chemotaxis family, protein-glutamate methylesterase/glutaminase